MVKQDYDIVIQSEEKDSSTDEIIQWLYYLKPNIKIYNQFNQYPIDDLKIEISNENVSISLNNIKVKNKWYRRGEYCFRSTSKKINKIFLKETYSSIKEYIDDSIYQKNINCFLDNEKFKLTTLNECIKLKIPIPETLITNNLNELKKFIKKQKRIITKPIENTTFRHHYGNYEVLFYPNLKVLESNDISHLCEETNFLPSLFQKYIDKKIEIRSFYLNGEFKSMAIFSQQNEKTKLDFRNYDYSRPNRNVPYQLPKDFETKLHNLMINLKINSGSFDIIYNKKGEYIFLEVNPIGQFQWLSHGCNYFIEEMFAKEFINYE